MNISHCGVQGRPQVKQTIKACSLRTGDAARIKNETCSQGMGGWWGEWGAEAAPRHAELEVKLAVRKNDYLNKSLSFEPHCNRTVTEQ